MNQNNKSPITFYDSPEKRHHLKSYAHGNLIGLIADWRKFLPFQIIRDTRADLVQTVLLRDFETNETIDISAQFASKIIVERFESDGYDVLYYKSLFSEVFDYKQGAFSLEIHDGVEWFYSDFFNCTADVSRLVKIEWYDIEDFIFQNGSGRILYSDNYRNWIYLDTQLSAPEWPLTETIDKRDGLSFREKQILEEIHKCKFVATKPILQVLVMTQIADYITIITEDDEYEAESILVTTPKWINPNFFAETELEIQTDSIMKKVGRGIIDTVGTSDFNDDFNNDFNIE